MPDPVVTPEPVAGGGNPNPTPEPKADPNPNPNPNPRPGAVDTSAWDKERAGFIADLKKEREQRQRIDTERQKYQSELEVERKRVLALSGVTPRRPEEQEDEEIKAAFAAKFPHLAELTAEDVKELRALKEDRSRFQEATNNHWANHGRRMIGSAQEQIADSLGGELTDRQRSRIAREYIAFVEENAANGALDRHEAADETFVQEFVKQFLGDWQESVRRSITTNEVARNRPVPSGRGRNVNIGGQKKIDFKDPKAVEDAMVAAFKDHGGSFTGGS